jgi:general secretion pathway protein A
VYSSWFGFREKPFNLTPDPKYLYLSHKHAEAFAHLEFGHKERGGFVVVSGEVGTGKTTLARYFLAKLGPDTHTAFVLYPALSAEELLRAVLDDLHVTPAGDSKKSLVDALHRFLLETRAAGHNVVLIIDEAQDLSPEVLEQVRLISNLETDTEKLIQIVLMGQSELRDLLRRHELRQLAQRVTARYHLTGLTFEETQAYIRHRLLIADGEGKVGFDHDALVAVHRLSEGIPRLVNLICDRALLAGYVHNSRRITKPMVRQAAKEVRDEQPRGPLRVRHGLVAAALTLVLAVLAFGLAPRRAQAPAAVPAPTLPPAAPTAPSPSGQLDTLVRELPREASFDSAAARVQSLWGRTTLARVALRTRLEQLRSFGLPAALELAHPARRDTCFATLLGLRERSAVVALGDEGALEVPLSQLDGLWTQDAVVWWPDRSDAEAGLAARLSLARLGFSQPDLAEAVARFQQQASLVADGRLGPRTRMALFALSPHDGPRLAADGGRP